MRITIIAMLATGLLGLSASLFAAGELPARGMTQDAVRAKFGAPSRQVAPVGNPPISRWVYADFTVYFEGKYSIHTVSHGKTLTTPQADAAATTAPAPVKGSVDELPPIEEIGESGTAPTADAAESAPAEPAPAPAENTFRFDPATGRIIEIGPDGKPVQSPTSQPGSSTPAPSEPAPAPAPEPAPAEEAEAGDSKAVAPVVAPATAPAGTGTSMRFDPSTGRMIEVGPDGTPVQPVEPAAAEPAAAEPAITEPAPAVEPEPAAAEPAPAAEQPAATPAEAPAAEPATGRFRFDPATGRIVMDGAEPTDTPAEPEQPAEQPTAPAAEPTPPAEPADAPAEPAAEPASSEPAAKDTETEKKPAEEAPEDSGFSIQW